MIKSPALAGPNLFYRCSVGLRPRLFTCCPFGTRRRFRRAFTLIEVMVVVAIISLIACIGIPAIYHAMHPESLQTAVNNVVEACAKARARAIWESAPVDLHWNPSQGQYQIVDAPKDAAPVDPTAAPGPGSVPNASATPIVSRDGNEAKSSNGSSGQISDL